MDPLGGLPEEPAPPRDALEENRPPPPPLPRHSSILMLVILGIFFAAEGIVGHSATVDDSWTLFRLGALYAPALHSGDWWRIGSYSFLHIGWVHIIMNGAALWALMPQIEATYGPNQAIGLYAATALCAGAASAGWTFLHGTPLPVAGASGGIFGLFGATIALFWRVRHRIPPEPRKRIVRGIMANLALNAIIAFSGYVDNAAHIGGLVTGVLFGLVAPLVSLPDRPWHRPMKWVLIASALALFAMEGAAVAWAVRPKPRTLHGEHVVAQLPGMLVPVKAGVAVSPNVAVVEIRAVDAMVDPSDEKVQLGDRTFGRQRSTADRIDTTQLAVNDEGGALVVTMDCASKECRGAAGDALIEKIAATVHRTP